MLCIRSLQKAQSDFTYCFITFSVTCIGNSQDYYNQYPVDGYLGCLPLFAMINVLIILWTCLCVLIHILKIELLCKERASFPSKEALPLNSNIPAVPSLSCQGVLLSLFNDC